MTALIILIAASWDYSYEATTALGYNDNIFAYSDEYIQDFIDQVRPYRFPFETYDDLEISQDISLLLRNRFFKTHTTTVNLAFNARHYLINKQKGRVCVDIGLRQSFGKWAIKADYELLPYYMIRYYSVPGGTSNDYEQCRVDYHKFTGKVSLFVFRTTDLHASYTHMIEKYHDPFTIYDANDDIGMLHLRHHFSSCLDMEVSYSFRASRSDITGIDTTADMPDASYDQHNPELRIIFSRRIILPAEIIAGYQYKFRNYLSSAPEDLLHYARQDHIHGMQFCLRLRVRTGMKLSFMIERDWRNATSTVYESISRVKDYSQTRIIGALIFYY